MVSLKKLYAGFSAMAVTTLTCGLMLIGSTAVNAQTVEDIRNNLMSGLAAPLPITVLGPMMVQTVDVVEEGVGFRVTLDSPLLLGMVPLQTVQFTLTPEGDAGELRVSDFSWPNQVPLFGAAQLNIGASDVTGLWSPANRSYSELDFEFSDLSIEMLGGNPGKIDIGSINLAVEKEGVADSTESRLQLALSDLKTSGLPPYDTSLARLSAELKANGEEPVDLYAVVSRFALLSAMQGDQSAALRFLESLRAKSYELVSLELEGTGLQVAGSDGNANGPSVSAEKVFASIGLDNITPNDWENALIAIDASGIVDNGLFEPGQLSALQSANLELSSKQLPVGAMISAVSQLMALEQGRQVSIDAGSLMDGLLGFENLIFETQFNGIRAKSSSERGPNFDIGEFGSRFAVVGLAQGEGGVNIRYSAKDLDVSLREAATKQARMVQDLLNPKAFNYDIAMDDLQLPLLRKMVDGVTIRNEDDAIALVMPGTVWFTALAPRITLVETFFEGNEFSFEAESDVTFYPAWFLSFPPYEGVSSMNVRGIDKLRALLEEVKATALPADATPRQAREHRDRTNGLAFAISAIDTLSTLAEEDGDRLIWAFELPEARNPQIVVNGMTLRVPDIFSALPALIAAGMRP